MEQRALETAIALLELVSMDNAPCATLKELQLYVMVRSVAQIKCALLILAMAATVFLVQMLVLMAFVMAKPVLQMQIVCLIHAFLLLV